MIDDQMIQQLREFIKAKFALTPKYFVKPTNYHALKERVLVIELYNELKYLTRVINLNFASDFKSILIARIGHRNNHPDQYTSFTQFPESPVNQLYWELVIRFLKPKSMGELLSFVAPKVERIVYLSTELMPDNFRLYSNFEKSNHLRQLRKNPHHMPVSIFYRPVGTLDMPPTEENFRHLVISGKNSLDTRQLKQMPIGSIGETLNLLSMQHSDLFTQLLKHNTFMSKLKSDADTYMGKALTPRMAMQKLIKLLRAGGEQMTGKFYAAKVAEKGIGEFNEYYLNLPVFIRQQVNNLEVMGFGESKRKKLKFADIFTHFEKGECIETAASFLLRFLAQNNADVLDMPPITKQSQLISLQQMYIPKDTNNNVVTERDNELTTLPYQPIQDLLSSFIIDQYEKLIPLLISFPVELYSHLFDACQFEDMDTIICELSSAIASQLFDHQQTTALARALMQSKKAFVSTSDTKLTFAVKTKHPLFLQLALELYNNSDALLSEHLKTRYYNLDRTTILHYVVSSDACLNLLHQRIGTVQLKKLLSVKDQFECTPFFYAVKNHETLNKLLSLYTNDLLESIFHTDKSGSNILHYAVEYPDSLKILRDKIGHDNFLKLAKQQNTALEMPLHLAISNIESFKLILNGFKNNEEKRKILSTPQSCGNSVWHLMANSPPLINEAIPLYKDTPGLLYTHLLKKNNDKSPVITCLWRNFDCLKMALEALSQEEISQVKKSQVFDGMTMLQFIASNQPENLAAMLAYYQDDEFSQCVYEADDEGHHIFHYAAHSVEGLKALISRAEKIGGNTIYDLAKDQHLLLFLAMENNNAFEYVLSLYNPENLAQAVDKSFYDKIAEGYMSFKDVLFKNRQLMLSFLKVSSSKEVPLAKNLEDKNGLSILHHLTADYPKQLATALSFYEKNQSDDYLLKTDNDNQTVFHKAAADINIFKMLYNHLSEKNKNIFYKQNLLEVTLDYPDTFIFILEQHPAEERLNTLCNANVVENTLLYKFLEKYPDNVEIFTKLPQGESIKDLYSLAECDSVITYLLMTKDTAIFNNKSEHPNINIKSLNDPTGLKLFPSTSSSLPPIPEEPDSGHEARHA